MEIYKVYCLSGLGGETQEGLYVDKDYALSRRDKLNKGVVSRHYRYHMKPIKVCTNNLEGK